MNKPTYTTSISLNSIQKEEVDLIKSSTNKSLKQIFMDGVSANLKEVPKDLLEKVKKLNGE
jgi:hypothetical protein